MIHAVAAVPHYAEYALFGGLFTALAALQAAWGAIVYRAPTARRLMAGVLLNTGVIAVWLASRSVGLPIGPGSGTAEQVGLADLGATVSEAALVGAALLVLRRPHYAARVPLWLRQALLAALIFGGVALMGAGHHHA
jgi:hypothetical protein